jgi:hypothetical protein
VTCWFLYTGMKRIRVQFSHNLYTITFVLLAVGGVRQELGFTREI